MAYCLIGIFDISISIAYGEGETAFYRLQVELMQRSDDRSIFHWEGYSSRFNSMLADGPHCFQFAGREVGVYYSPPLEGNPSYTLTNSGIRMRVLIYPSTHKEVKEALMAQALDPLYGEHVAIIAQISSSREYLAVLLNKFGEEEYTRAGLISLAFSPSLVTQGEIRKIFIA